MCLESGAHPHPTAVCAVDMRCILYVGGLPVFLLPVATVSGPSGGGTRSECVLSIGPVAP